MTDWTAGYVADIVYSYGYYHELNPLRVKLAFLTAGLVTPAEGTHCELGFGQGVSMNIHAAASGDEWYGTDFNPSQASFAQELAKVSEAQVHLYDQSFAEFCIRDKLKGSGSLICAKMAGVKFEAQHLNGCHKPQVVEVLSCSSARRLAKTSLGV